MLSPALTDRVGQPRNLLHVNFEPDEIGYIGSWFAKRARLIQLTELGSVASSIKVRLPIGSPNSVLMRASASYLQSPLVDENHLLPAVFGSCIAPRMIVAQEIRSIGLFEEICSVFLPDIVAFNSRIDLAARWYQEYQLLPASDLLTESERGAWGVPGLSLWANEAGKRCLRHSLTMFDGEFRRRKRETSRVYDVGSLILCDGFHPVESECGNQWAWTGSDTVATLLVPSHGNGRLRITLFLFGAKITINAENIDILVDGAACACDFFLQEKIEIVTGYLRAGCSHRVDIFQSRTISTSDGSRQIGFALHKVRIESVP